jgi:hypothetical protein
VVVSRPVLDNDDAISLALDDLCDVLENDPRVEWHGLEKAYVRRARGEDSVKTHATRAELDDSNAVLDAAGCEEYLGFGI